MVDGCAFGAYQPITHTTNRTYHEKQVVEASKSIVMLRYVFLISIDPVYLSNEFIRYSKCDIYRHRSKHGGSPQGYDTRRLGGIISIPQRMPSEYIYVIQSSGKLSLSLCVFWCETAVHSVNVTDTITTNTRWYIDVNGNIKLETRMGQRRRIKRISRRESSAVYVLHRRIKYWCHQVHFVRHMLYRMCVMLENQLFALRDYETMCYFAVDCKCCGIWHR